MKRATSVLLALVLTAGLAAASANRVMSIEDALAIRNAGAPVWSPDGKRLAFTVSDWLRKDNRRRSHIYVVGLDGAAPMKLTNGERGESNPQWSPDGSRIAFLANRSPGQQDESRSGQGNQVWMISVNGGEAERVTEETSSISTFQWSPDGKSIAYVVRDEPEDKAERDRKRRDRFDTIVVDSDYTYSHLWVMDLETKEKTRLTTGQYTVTDPRWSPDSQWICFVVSFSGSQESSFTDISENRNTDVFLVPAKGGESRRLTTNPGPDSQPRFSPNGSKIAYLSGNDPGSWAQKTELMVIETDGGQPRSLTANHPDSVLGSPEWSNDGAFIYVSGMVGVYNQLLRVSSSGGKPEPVFQSAGAYTAFSVSNDGGMLAYLKSDSATPSDIWIASADGKGEKRLTDLNPDTEKISLGTTEVIKWKGADGFEIEGLLVKPVGYREGERYPTILQIHGGPYARFSYGFNSRAQIFAGQGYALLLPNPRGSTGYGHTFVTANVEDWGGKDFKDIMAGVDELIRRGIADPSRLAVMGGSYGGFMTFWTITQTDRFRAAIGHAGISDWYSFHGQSDIPGLMEYGFGGTPWSARDTYVKYSPMTHVERVRTPIMITHGERDLRVPIAQAEQYYRALKKSGVEVVFLRYPRAGHGITEPNHQIDLVQRQLEWFERHVKSARPDPAAR